MYVYWYVFLLAGFFALIEVSVAQFRILGANNKKFNSFYLVIFCSFIFFFSFFAGLRLNVGYDYFSYKDYYETILDYNTRDALIEYGYYVLNYVIASFDISFPHFLLLLTLISFVPKGISIWIASPLPFVSVFLYYVSFYIMYDFGVLRQSLALTFCVISYKYLIDGDVKKFTFAVFVASLFHITALIFIGFYFVGRYRTSIIAATVLLFFSAIFSVFASGVIDGISGFSGYLVSEKVGLYTDSVEYTTGIGYTVGFLFKIIFLYLYAFSFSKGSEMNLMQRVGFNAYLISLMGFLMFNDFGIFAGRTFSYFKVAEVFLIPDLLYRVRYKWYCLPAFLLIIGGMGYQFDRDLSSEVSDVLFPYQYFFSF